MKARTLASLGRLREEPQLHLLKPLFARRLHNPSRSLRLGGAFFLGNVQLDTLVTLSLLSCA